MSRPLSPLRRPPVLGPERATRSRGDPWRCAVAVAAHGASLDPLEERLVDDLRDRTGGLEGIEEKLSHLADLRVRLDDVHLVSGDLATREVPSERGRHA